jgi:hypothetical protein
MVADDGIFDGPSGGALSPNFLSSAESGALLQKEREANYPVYSGINVFDLLNEPDPLVKYNLNWTQPEVRDYVRRLYFLSQHRATLIKTLSTDWITRVHNAPHYIGSMALGDTAFTGNTPESAIDSALSAISPILDNNYRMKIREELKEETKENPNREFIKFLAIYGTGIFMGFLIGLAFFK